MSDPLRRSLRTAFQVFLVSLIGALYAYVQNLDFSKGIPDLTTLKAAATVIIGTALVALVAWGQNHLEDLGLLPAILKAPASSGADPVPPARVVSPSAAQSPVGNKLVTPAAPSGAWGSPSDTAAPPGKVIITPPTEPPAPQV